MDFTYKLSPKQTIGPDCAYDRMTLRPYSRDNDYETVYVQNDFKPRLPTFEGKHDTWEPFLMQLNLLSHNYNWSDRKFREQLIFALRGEALIFASSLPLETTQNTEKLLRSMRQRFGECVLPETHRANLYNVKKQRKENLQEYSDRVNRMMVRGYPGIQGTKLYHSLAVEHFLRGLSDQKLAYEIMIKKPRDLSEAVYMVTWHEACIQITNKTVINRVDVPTQKSKSRKQYQRCYNCRKKGHESKQCPEEPNQTTSTDI